MLPFTKRPVRIDDSGVVSKSAPLSGIRPPAESGDEDERTKVLDGQSLTGSFSFSQPLPPSIDDDEDDEEEGRTVVRDNPTSIVPRKLAPVSIRPASIAPVAPVALAAPASLRSAQRRGHILPAPPPDLLEEEQSDYSDRLSAHAATSS